MVTEVAHGLSHLGFGCFHGGNDTTHLDRLFPILNPPLETIFSLCPVGVYFDLITAFQMQPP